jgi:predicted DNA-binding mobile mystery protein A
VESGVEKEGNLSMRKRDRRPERLRLDEEMKPFRTAGREANPTEGLLRAVRHTVGIPLTEIAARMGVAISTVTDLERRELEGAITVRSLARLADAMGCKVVYGVVPKKGRTLEYLVEERLWRKVLGAGNSDEGSGWCPGSSMQNSASRNAGSSTPFGPKGPPVARDDRSIYIADFRGTTPGA